MSSTKQEGRILQRGPSRKGLRSAIPDARKVEAAFAKMDLSPGGLARIAAVLRRLGPLSGAELRRIARDAETLMGHSAPATDRILRSVMKWISLDQLSIKPEMAASLPPNERAEALARVAACAAALAACEPNTALPVAEPDDWIPIDEAISLLHVDRRWLFRHKALPWIRILSRKRLLVNKTGALAWLKAGTRRRG
jgi:hypothetical protein